MLSVLVLFVLIAIVYQIRIGTLTDARVSQNDVGLSIMDRAMESAKWDVYEMLKVDGEDATAGGGGELPGGSMGAEAGGDAGAEGETEEEAPADSSKDEWARVQRTSINDIDLRILVEAENAKYNVLNILVEDEEEAEEAFQRVVRIIDLYREDTEADLTDREAEDMVREMKDYILERSRGNWPEPELLTFDEDRDNVFLPLSLQEFLVLESWEPHFFRCYRDKDDRRVYSLDQFLTVWSSPGVVADIPAGNDDSGLEATPEPEPEPEADSSGAPGAGDEAEAENEPQAAPEPGGQSPGGYGVNLNLAPLAVLAGLFDDRDVRVRFWDDVIEYRNLDEEEEDDEDEQEPLFDQFNEEIRDRRAFESLEELSEVPSWEDHDPETQSRIMSLLETESDVFTIYITARRETSVDGSLSSFSDSREKEREEELPGGALVRTARAVVWRREGEDGVEIVPIIPWEVLDYRPFEFQDYPDERY